MLGFRNIYLWRKDLKLGGVVDKVGRGVHFDVLSQRLITTSTEYRVKLLAFVSVSGSYGVFVFEVYTPNTFCCCVCIVCLFTVDSEVRINILRFCDLCSCVTFRRGMGGGGGVVG